MAEPVTNIVIVGGGAAGWITAGLVAARARLQAEAPVHVTVIEAPDIPIVGVGEGTWPTMRSTLRAMGISEADFIRKCSVSLKQGSKFCGWRTGEASDFYYHPFDAPFGGRGGAAEGWLQHGTERAAFSPSVCPQEALCEKHLSPKSLTSPDYAGFTNYGYHLDAGAFSVFLRDHCTTQLGVRHIADAVTEIRPDESGDIAAVATRHSGDVSGDLFVDCTGFRSLLLGQHYGVPLVSHSDVLFADRALAVQVPWREGESVQSCTVGTALTAGWVWDVSLASRRGVGYVFSTAHRDEDEATAELLGYLGRREADAGDLQIRSIGIGAGHRETFWQGNCVAIGLSAGFLEPLEASALMMVELAAGYLAENGVNWRSERDRIRDSYNSWMSGVWQNVIHFLKLHYVLSARSEPFWQDNRSAASVPSDLREDLERWKSAVPDLTGFSADAAVFPPDSYHYVLYGMGYDTRMAGAAIDQGRFEQECRTVAAAAGRLEGMLLGNRAFLDTLGNAARRAG